MDSFCPEISEDPYQDLNTKAEVLKLLYLQIVDKHVNKLELFIIDSIISTLKLDWEVENTWINIFTQKSITFSMAGLISTKGKSVESAQKSCAERRIFVCGMYWSCLQGS